MAKDLKRRIIAEFSAKNKAKGVMGGFRRDLDVTGRALRRMAVGALAVAGIGGLGYMLKRQMEVIDSTAKLSDRLNITTESLVAMQHGAGIAGVQQETFNKSLEIFVRRLGEVDMGVGQATYALDKLGLDYKELIGLSVDKSFGRIADQIKGLATQAEKAAAANYLFGRSGQVLLNFFEKGSEGLKEYKEFVEKTGLAFSRFDAAQVEAANDALMNVRAVLTGLFRQATIELAPYIEALANKFVDIATAGEGLGANVTSAFEAMSIGAIKFGEALNEIPAVLSSIKAAMYDVASYWEMLAPVGMGYGIYRKIKGQKSSSEIAADLRARAQQQKQIAAQQVSAIQKFYDDLRKKAKPDFMTTFPEVRRFEAEPFSWEKVPQKITDEHRKAAEEIDQVWTEMWLKQEETAYHAMRAPIIAAEGLAKESAERRKRIAEDIALSLARSWSSAMDQMMFEGKKFWDAMIDMARGLIREIVNIIVYKKIAEPFAYGIMGIPVPSAQYGGEVTKTGLAVIHRGEKYSGMERIGGNLDVHIHNEGEGKFEISEVEEYAISDQRIIDVTIRAAGAYGPYQRSIRQIRSNV